ncbi:MAG: AraC family ligand binding domain-containing protein, partial [Caenispirillum bisanense]|nr:AraC family ligand binding domain-containing protein [Caenispirillum bisanense]MCA1974724.1 AraC family ligand binding domain-containing protein [Caenispirillum sp.]
MGAITRLWRGDGVEVVRVRAPGGRLAYDRHFHDDWVIGVNLTGREHLWLDHRDHDVAAGSITAYEPGAVQAGTFEGPEADFVSLYVTQEAWRRLAADAAGDGDAVLARPVIDDPAAAAGLVALA